MPAPSTRRPLSRARDIIGKRVARSPRTRRAPASRKSSHAAMSPSQNGGGDTLPPSMRSSEREFRLSAWEGVGTFSFSGETARARRGPTVVPSYTAPPSMKHVRAAAASPSAKAIRETLDSMAPCADLVLSRHSESYPCAGILRYGFRLFRGEHNEWRFSRSRSSARRDVMSCGPRRTRAIAGYRRKPGDLWSVLPWPDRLRRAHDV